MGAGSGGGGGGGGVGGGGIGGQEQAALGPSMIEGLQKQGLLWSPNFYNMFPNAPGNPGSQQQQGGVNQAGFPPNFQGGQQTGAPNNMWFWTPQYNDWLNLDAFTNLNKYGGQGGNSNLSYYPGNNQTPNPGFGSSAGLLQGQGY